MTVPDDLAPLSQKPFADAISQLEGLLTSGDRAFLIGAGCSKCAGLPLTAELTAKVLASVTLSAPSSHLLTSIQASFAGSPLAHIEDFLSEIIDWLAIADRREGCLTTERHVSIAGEKYESATLRSAVEEIKGAIAEAVGTSVTLACHRQFVKAVHRPSRPGRPLDQRTVEYLVLNYDTLLESALALERIPFADGLDGGVTAWWCPGTYERDGLEARVMKLHGSLDWCLLDDDPLPRRVGKGILGSAGGAPPILIWPASTKYRETQLDPYAQLASRAREVLGGSRSGQRVLAILGYSFSDSHVNRDLDRALRASSKDLTIVAFTSEEQPTGTLAEWRKDLAIAEQVLVYSKRGFYHGSKEAISADDLPWWKFENIARILAGER